MYARLTLCTLVLCFAVACDGNSEALASIEVTGPADCAKGHTGHMVATAVWSDGHKRVVTSEASWLSTDPGLVSVSNESGTKGAVRCLAEGPAQIVAVLDKRASRASITVTAKVLAAIEIAPAGGAPLAAVPAGTSRMFAATAVFSDQSRTDVTADVAWTSSNDAVIAVAGGMVTAKTPGSARVTAKLEDVLGATEITAGNPSVTRLELSAPTQSLAKGPAVQLAATGHYSDGSQKDVTAEATWASANAAVAAVVAGRVQSLTTGQTTITAALEDATAQVTLQVTGAAVTQIVVSPVNPDLPAGVSQQMTAVGLFSDDTTQDLTSTATWSSSDPLVLALDSGHTAGLFWAVRAGQATASASFGDKTGSVAITVSPARLLNVAVTPASARVPRLTTQRFTATGTYTDNSTRDLSALATWSSSNPQVISIDAAGVATGLVEGSAEIHASYQGKNPFTPVTVVRAALITLQIEPSTVSLAKGRKQRFTATGVYADGSTLDLSSQVAWSSSDPAVAVVSTAETSVGVASTFSTGNTTITATASGVTGSAALAVRPAELDELQVDHPSLSLAKGTRQQLRATAIYSDGTTVDVAETASWLSQAPATATVSTTPGTRGEVSAIAEGSTSVSVQYSGQTTVVPVTVTAARLLTLGVSPTDLSMPKGTQRQYFAIGVYSDGTSQDLTAQAAWVVAGGPYAVVSAAGLVTALAAGAVDVRATHSGITGFTHLTVLPAALVSVAVTPATWSFPKGTTVQLVARATYSDANVIDVSASASWSSSSPSVSVSAAGLARAEAPSPVVTVSVLFQGQSASAQLTPTAARLDRIDVAPLNPSMAQATTRQFQALGSFSDGSVVDITAQVLWASSDPNLATLSNSSGSNGLASSVNPGVTSVSATKDGVSVATNLTVVSGTISRIDLVPATPTAAKGTVRQLFAQATLSDGSTQDVTAQATWVSSNDMVATVSNALGSRGLATAVALGFADLTATVSGVSGATRITVLPAALVSITLTPQNPVVATGASVQLRAYGSYTDGTSVEITTDVVWASSNDASATVSNSQGTQGLVSGVAPGAATISASLAGKTMSTSVTVSGP